MPVAFVSTVAGCAEAEAGRVVIKDRADARRHDIRGVHDVRQIDDEGLIALGERVAVYLDGDLFGLLQRIEGERAGDWDVINIGRGRERRGRVIERDGLCRPFAQRHVESRGGRARVALSD